MSMFKLRGRYLDHHLEEFAGQLIGMSNQIGFKVSARGWAYLMEQNGMINKSQFDKVNNLINTCRKKGFLPIDFVAEESSRQFYGVETPYNGTVFDKFSQWLGWTLNVDEGFDVDWWDGEQYYIQMVVEKVDLVTLFSPVCRRYKIPIANSRGWSSMLQRAEYARRYKEAQDQGLRCVLLYCGDFDPDGLRISEFLRSNLNDLKYVSWDDGEDGYDPEDLIIDRFGLNYDFIVENNFTWIDNLITGSGRNLASPRHKNFDSQYVQEYLRDVGERKCEANVIVTNPSLSQELCEGAISKYLGTDAANRFKHKQDKIKADFARFKKEHKIDEKVNQIIDIASNYEQ